MSHRGVCAASVYDEHSHEATVVGVRSLLAYRFFFVVSPCLLIGAASLVAGRALSQRYSVGDSRRFETNFGALFNPSPMLRSPVP